MERETETRKRFRDAIFQCIDQSQESRHRFLGAAQFIARGEGFEAELLQRLADPEDERPMVEIAEEVVREARDRRARPAPSEATRRFHRALRDAAEALEDLAAEAEPE